MPMTKSELVEKLAARFPQLLLRDADIAVKTILDAMSDALADGHRIEIRGFGSFGLNRRPPRVGRNPKSGEKVLVPEKRVPHFKAGKELRERVDRSLEAAGRFLFGGRARVADGCEGGAAGRRSPCRRFPGGSDADAGHVALSLACCTVVSRTPRFSRGVLWRGRAAGALARGWAQPESATMRHNPAITRCAGLRVAVRSRNRMKLFVWVVRILLFVLLFVLALHNTAEVSLVLPFGVVWHAPLILIALAFFVAGLLLAMLAMAPRVMRHRFTASRLRRQLGRMKAEEAVEPKAPVVADSPYHVPGPKV